MVPSSPFLPRIFERLTDVALGKVNHKECGGRDLSFVLEDIVYLAFRVLGFDEAKQEGYKASGSKFGHPDGLLRSKQSNYAAVYDVKQRTSLYSINSQDKRALEEYLTKQKNEGYSKLYCVNVAGGFGNTSKNIAGCPTTYIPTDVIKALLVYKIQNPLKVHASTLEPLFSKGGVVDEPDIEKWADELELEILQASPEDVQPSTPYRGSTVRGAARQEIPGILGKRGMNTQELYKNFQELRPSLCNDKIRCGKDAYKSCQVNEPAWYHDIRWALLDLIYAGQIYLDKKKHLYWNT